MKSSFAIISVIVLARISLVGAQPVLTDENTLRRLMGLSVDFGTHEILAIDEAEHLVQINGNEQTWDLSGLPFAIPDTQSTYFAQWNPGMPNAQDPRLADANLVAVSGPESASWTYQRLDETGHFLLGRVTLQDVDQDGRKDTLVNVFDPISTVFPFPLTMGTSWADSSTQTLEFQGSPPVPVETVVATHVVEGWGTLISPDGMSPALRIRTEARVTASGGQKSIRRTIRLVTPVPEDLLENTVYTSRVEMVVDSLDSLLEFSYVSLSAYRALDSESEDPVTHTVDLGPAYPNPFRGATTIPFQLADAGRVRISVFDIVGRRVEEVMDRTLQPGTHRVTWDAASMPSGVYRILLESRNAASSRLVVVQR